MADRQNHRAAEPLARPGAVRRDMRWQAPLRLAMAPLVAGLAILLGGCGDEPPTFRVLTLQASPVVARNESLRLSFSRPVARNVPLRSVITIKDLRGKSLEIQARIDDDGVVLQPGDPLGWPADDELQVAVSPGHAAAFRSSDGLPLTAESAFQIKVGRDYKDFGDAFILEADEHGAMIDVGRDFVITCRFSLPIDRDSFAGSRPAFVVHCLLGEGRTRQIVPEVALGPDGRTVHVRPWPRKSPVFDAGREHRLVILPHLRSVTGRALATSRDITFVSTRRDRYEGYVDVSFAVQDLDSRDNPWLRDDRAFVRPQPRPFSTEVFNDEFRRREHEWPWSPTPCRFQIRLPGVRLRDEPGLVTGFSFMTRSAIPEGLVFPRVIVRLAHPLTDGEAIGADLDANMAAPEDGIIHETVVRGSAGDWRPPGGAAPGPSGRWIDFWLDRPFYYRGRSRDLVLEIRNERGAMAADRAGAPRAAESIGWVTGESTQGNGPRSAWTEGGDPFARHGVTADLVFATKLHIERYVDIESRWYEADIENPGYWILPAAGELDADGAENEDFRFWYKGMGADGLESAEWLPLVSQVDGCRKIKVKVSFLPSSRRRPDTYPEVRRLRIRYRQTD